MTIGNLIDKAVGVLSPVAQLKRVAARQALSIMNTGYSEHGASRSKQWSRGWNDKGGSAREDIELNLPVLRRRARLLYMGGGLGRAAIRRMRTNVIGTGLQLRASPDFEALGISEDEAQAWSRRVEREFRLWADSKDCDITGLNTFDQLTGVALMNWLMSGDVFPLLLDGHRDGQPYDLRVSLIEADRVCTPGGVSVNGVTLTPALSLQGRGGTAGEIRDGVEIGANGEVVAYHVANFHPLSSTFVPGGQVEKKWKRVPVYGPKSGRRLILHLMEQERVGLYRGVPFLAGVIEDLKQISRYTEAELLAAVVSAFFTVFVKSKTPDNPLAESVPVSEQVTAGDSDAANKYELGPGSMIGLEPDEDIAVANPQRPNVNFDGFVNSIAAQIGASLEIPYEVLVMRFNSSFSAARAAILQGWMMFRQWRAWMAADFCGPIYEEWMTEAILNGRIEAPGFFDDPGVRAAWLRASWHGPVALSLDPVKEATASKIRIETKISTREREAAESNGMDISEVISQLGAEEKQLEAAGLTASGSKQ